MSQEIDILSHITACLPSLREAEKKVANLIFDDIDFVAEASIGEIAMLGHLMREAPGVVLEARADEEHDASRATTGDTRHAG